MGSSFFSLRIFHGKRIAIFADFLYNGLYLLERGAVMRNLAFDNEKYLQLQSQHIRQRIDQFGGKL